jgi:hypothetical protein
MNLLPFAPSASSNAKHIFKFAKIKNVKQHAMIVLKPARIASLLVKKQFPLAMLRQPNVFKIALPVLKNSTRVHRHARLV